MYTTHSGSFLIFFVFFFYFLKFVVLFINSLNFPIICVNLSLKDTIYNMIRFLRKEPAYETSI